MNTRRQFLITAPLGVVGAAVACGGSQRGGSGAAPSPATPGAPPTFGAAPAVGPAGVAVDLRRGGKARCRSR